VVDQLAALIRNGAVPKDDEWVGSVLDWLVIHGLFEVKKKSKDSPYQAVGEIYTYRSPSLIRVYLDSDARQARV
jgi:DNA polymerase phi